jgi:hypothetical protein
MIKTNVICKIAKENNSHLENLYNLLQYTLPFIYNWFNLLKHASSCYEDILLPEFCGELHTIGKMGMTVINQN